MYKDTEITNNEYEETKKKIENEAREIINHLKQTTNKKINRFKIVEKQDKEQAHTNIKILSRWDKKELVSRNLVEVKNVKKTFDDSFFLSEANKDSVMAVNDVSF